MGYARCRTGAVIRIGDLSNRLGLAMGMVVPGLSLEDDLATVELYRTTTAASGCRAELNSVFTEISDIVRQWRGPHVAIMYPGAHLRRPMVMNLCHFVLRTYFDVIGIEITGVKHHAVGFGPA